MQRSTLALTCALLFLCAACTEPTPPPPPVQAAEAPAVDSLEAERQQYIDQILASIAGRENDPAGEVFENVQRMGNMPARRLLAIMNMGYSRSLGVSCTHCHNPDLWADDTREKNIAREMSAMTRRINNELLPAIASLGDGGEQPPVVNCTTCHRGQVKPALNLPEPVAAH